MNIRKTKEGLRDRAMVVYQDAINLAMDKYQNSLKDSDLIGEFLKTMEPIDSYIELTGGRAKCTALGMGQLTIVPLTTNQDIGSGYGSSLTIKIED